MRLPVSWLLTASVLAGSVCSSILAGEPTMVPVGAAVVDITPDYPVRMVGYESRKTESEGIASRLKVRALAIGGDGDANGGPAVLVAVDNCAVASKFVEEVAARLKKKAKIARERFVVCATHTHCAPGLSSGLDFIFGNPLPPEERSHIDRYTRELTDAIEKVALDALAARSPASLAWGQGRTGFAANRRVLKDGHWLNFGVNPNGPVDHSVPVLRATDATGKVKAVLFGYACHCTTLGGEFNKICAEWAGYACDEIEQQSPGAIGLAIIGCGADANPEPRRNLDDAKQHGLAAGREVGRLVKSSLTPLAGRIESRLRRIELPLEPVPGRAKLMEQTKARRGYRLPGQDIDRTARSRRVTSQRPCPTSFKRGALATTWRWSFWPVKSWSTTPCASSGKSTRNGSGWPPTATMFPATSHRDGSSAREDTRPISR